MNAVVFYSAKHNEICEVKKAFEVEISMLFNLYEAIINSKFFVLTAEIKRKKYVVEITA